MAIAASADAELEIGRRGAARMAAFAAMLRDNGFAIGLAENRDALTVLASPAATRPSGLRAALKALFCATRSDWMRFEALFDAFWLGRGVRRVQSARGGEPSAARKKPVPRGLEADGAPATAESHSREAGIGDHDAEALARDEASSVPTLSAKDIRHIADREEALKAHALAERLARRMRARLVRRERARRSGRRLDVRRTIHRSVSRGGTPVDLVWRRRKPRPLRLVLLLDASGSMEPYTAFFVRFIHGVVEAFREAEAFVFHTSLVHVSSALRERDVERAVDRLAMMAQGIGGGTRIGESLAEFNRWHGERVVNSRTALIIVSDGYDTGAPERLADEMRRLARRCRRIVWLNPLIGWRDYQPTARGMRAALPYVDLFAPAHNLESLAALEPYLARI